MTKSCFVAPAFVAPTVLWAGLLSLLMVPVLAQDAVPQNIPAPNAAPALIEPKSALAGGVSNATAVAPSLALKEGEILLWGTVDALTDDALMIEASGFLLPNGRGRRFAYSVPKEIQLSPATLMAMRHSARWQSAGLSTSGFLTIGSQCLIIGADSGNGQPVSARFLGDVGKESLSSLVPGIAKVPQEVLPAVEIAPKFYGLPPELRNSSPDFQPSLPSRSFPPRPFPPNSASAPPAVPSGWEVPATALMTLDDITPWLYRLAAAYPTQVNLINLGTTAQGRPLLAVEVRPARFSGGPLRRLAVICRQHGDEPEATAAGCQFLLTLLQSQASGVLQVRQQTAVIVVPVANPDGAAGNRRLNALGQDLNRDWGRGYTGEVSALTRLIGSFRPHALVDVHQWVPGDATQTPMVEFAGGGFGRRLASQMGRGLGFGVRSSGATGTLCHRYWASRGLPAVLLESVHRPGSLRQRERAIATKSAALLNALQAIARA